MRKKDKKPIVIKRKKKEPARIQKFSHMGIDSYELLPKTKLISLRLSEQLLEQVKKQAERSHMNYHKFIRLVLEKAI